MANLVATKTKFSCSELSMLVVNHMRVVTFLEVLPARMVMRIKAMMLLVKLELETVMMNFQKDLHICYYYYFKVMIKVEYLQVLIN